MIGDDPVQDAVNYPACLFLGKFDSVTLFLDKLGETDFGVFFVVGAFFHKYADA